MNGNSRPASPPVHEVLSIPINRAIGASSIKYDDTTEHRDTINNSFGDQGVQLIQGLQDGKGKDNKRLSMPSQPMTPGDQTMHDVVSIDMEGVQSSTHQNAQHNAKVTSTTVNKETHVSEKVLNVIENEHLLGGKLDSEYTESVMGQKRSFNLQKHFDKQGTADSTKYDSFKLP